MDNNFSLLKMTGLICLVFLISAANVLATTYYVDASGGNDDANGTSQSTAWRTLSKVNSFTFQPGDQILFKAGSVWNERLSLNGSGVAGNPIVVDMYGAGNKPIFNGGGGSGSLPTVLLENEEYWELNNLEITNTNGSISTYQSDLWGIRVNVTQGGEFNHIYIRNCYIHAVGSDVPEAASGGKLAGGIYVTVESPSGSPAWYNDVKIQNNVVGGNTGGDLVGGLGIATQSTHGRLNQGADRKPFLNVVVSDNIVGPTGRNNIIIRVSDNAIVEHNLLREAGRFSKGHSVFNFNTENLIVQYNEAYGNTGPASDADRGGFDADYNARDTYFQYNYSHDNNWGFAWMKRGINENAVFRYNISQDDKLAIYFYGFDSDPGPQNALAYNNTHYVSSNLNVEVFKDRTAQNTNFYNNIFYFEGSGSWGSGTPNNCTFENNAFYNISTRGTNFVTADPQLVNGGNGGQEIDWSNYPNVLTVYHLQSGSPCIDAGRTVANNGGQDFWGNSLYNGAPDIGAHEFTGGGEPTLPVAPGGMSAAPASSSQINLTWSDNSNNEDGFKVERKTTGSYIEIADLGSNVTSYNDTGLSASTQYTYRARAYNTAGNSSYSNEASATTQSGGGGGTTTEDIFVSEDAYIRGGSNSGANYGSAATLVIKESTNLSFTRRALLQFDLTSYSSISSARLFVYGSAQSTLDISAYKASPDTWSESTVTWDNAPTFGTLIGSVSVSTSDQWYEIDVTSAAQDEITGNGTLSVGLKDDAALKQTINIFSKENTQSQFKSYVKVTGSTGGTAVTGVSVTPSSITVDEGSTVALTAIVTPSNATDPGVTWSTSNSSVATVNSSGVVTGVTAGSATIIATTNDGNFTDNSLVTVNSTGGGTPIISILNPTDDAYVRGGSNANNNFGSVNEMVIKKGSNSSYFRKAYVKFDLGGIGDVQSATVRLYANTVSAFTVSVYDAGDGWNEGNITWNNAPSEGSVLASTSVNNAGQYYEWDVTSYVQEQASGDGTVTLVFYDDASNNSQIKFNSKEASSNIPELVVDGIVSAGARKTGSIPAPKKKEVDDFKSKVGLYPNPTSGVLTLSGISEINRIEVFQLHGALVMSLEHAYINEHKKINISSLKDGPYHIKIYGLNGEVTQHHIIKRN